jgi:hypothetical protein
LSSLGSGRFLHLGEVAHETGKRPAQLLWADAAGVYLCQGQQRRIAGDRHWRNLLWC